MREQGSRGGVLSTALQAVMLVLLLAILAAVMLVLFAVVSVMNVSGQVGGGLAGTVGGVVTQASHAVGDAQRAVQSATDPTHPPSGLVQDTEFSALQVLHVGDQLPGGSQYVLSLQSINRRAGADSVDTALYAVIHAELRQPRETRLLGQLLRSDKDPHEYVVYKGESFRIGKAVYRANWLSDVESAMAIAAYRSPDSVSAPLKLDYE